MNSDWLQSALEVSVGDTGREWSPSASRPGESMRSQAVCGNWHDTYVSVDCEQHAFMAHRDDSGWQATSQTAWFVGMLPTVPPLRHKEPELIKAMSCLLISWNRSPRAGVEASSRRSASICGSLSPSVIR